MKTCFVKLFMVLIAVVGLCSCSDDDGPSGKNVLDTPKVSVPLVTESSAQVVWDAVGNATAYVYSFNGGEEKTTTETSVAIDNLSPEQTYSFKVKAVKTGSLYFADSEYAEISFTTTAHQKQYRVATFADDWDKWYYEYNDDSKVKRVYRLTGSGELDREWNFSCDGNTVSVTGKNNYTITLNDKGFAETFVDGKNTYKYTYDDDGYMTQVVKNGEVCSNIVVENGDIMKWSKFADGVEQWKLHTYGDKPNVAGVHCIYSEKCGASRWLVETGLFGKASNHLHTSNQWDYSSSASTFEFDFDDNSCVTAEHKIGDGYTENYFYTYDVK